MLALDLLHEVDRLQNEMNRLFGTASRARHPESPAMNVWASESELLVQAELPGMNASDLDIAVEGDTLTLRGSRPETAVRDGEAWIRRERSGGSFARSIELPFRVDADKVDAAYAKGVLTVRLPRVAAEQPKRIAVKSA